MRSQATILQEFDFSVPIGTLAAKCRARDGTEEYDRLVELSRPRPPSGGNVIFVNMGSRKEKTR